MFNKSLNTYVSLFIHLHGDIECIIDTKERIINPTEIFIKEFTFGKCIEHSDFKLGIFLFSNTNFYLKKDVKIKEPIINHLQVNFFEYF